jgi:hypothetical protein
LINYSTQKSHADESVKPWNARMICTWKASSSLANQE